MRARAVLREAGRDILSGAAGTLRLSLVYAVALCGLVLLETGTVRDLIARSEAFHRAGASVLILTAEGLIDGASCDRLGELPGVRASGAIRAEPEGAAVIALALPDTPIPAHAVSPGFARILGAEVGAAPTESGTPTEGGTPEEGSARRETPGGGVFLGEEAAALLAATPGGALPTTAGEARIAGTYAYPVDGRRTGLSFAVLVPRDHREPFDECWADAWPAVDGLERLLATAVLPSMAEAAGARSRAPEIAQLNSRLGQRFDGAELFAARPSAASAPLAAAAGMALVAAALRLRRLPLASALHSGVGRRALTAIQLIETASWLALGTIAGLAIALAQAQLAGAGNAPAVLVLGARVVAAGAAGALLGTPLALATIRESALFRYFQGR